VSPQGDREGKREPFAEQHGGANFSLSLALSRTATNLTTE
jgi:hypothetical protein